MTIDESKLTPEFREEINEMMFRHQEEVFWHGSVDSEGGWKLLAKQSKELEELMKKYGVIKNDV